MPDGVAGRQVESYLARGTLHHGKHFACELCLKVCGNSTPLTANANALAGKPRAENGKQPRLLHEGETNVLEEQRLGRHVVDVLWGGSRQLSLNACRHMPQRPRLLKPRH